MGCDIHLFTEKKIEIDDVFQWVNIDNWKLNPYYKILESESQYDINEVYRGRSYSLFSMLADVRNDSGNKFICKPKGLPRDASNIVKEKYEDWGKDAHSCSFFTMEELYDFYNKNDVVKYSGLVDTNGAKKIDSGESPEWSCKGASDKSLV